MAQSRPSLSETFLDILIENQPGLLRTARRVVRNEMEAEDVVQEVALTVLSTPDMLGGVQNIAAWLATLAYRRGVDALRKKSPRRFSEWTEANESAEDGRSSALDVQVENERLDALIAGRAPHDALYDAVACALLLERSLISNEELAREVSRRLSPGVEVRLRYAYYVTCKSVVKDAAGKVTEVHCTYDPATRGGEGVEGVDEPRAAQMESPTSLRVEPVAAR